MSTDLALPRSSTTAVARRTSPRWSDWLVPVLMIVLILQLPLLAAARSWGLPVETVRVLGFTKDVLAVALAIAGLAMAAGRRARLDAVDLVVLGYVAVVSAHLAVATLVPTTGGLGASPEAGFWVLFAYRGHVAGVVLMLATRGFADRERVRKMTTRTLVVLGVVLALGAMVEQLRPDTWERLGTAIGMGDYQEEVFGVDKPLVVRTEVGGRDVVRAGSLLFDYLEVGFVLLTPFAVAVFGLARHGRARDWLAAGVLGAGILATLTRSAIIAAAVALLGAALWAPLRWTRRRLAALLIGGSLAVGGAALAAGVGPRLAATFDPAAESTSLHLAGWRRGIEMTADNPFGAGLGVGPDVAARTGTGIGALTENSYLQVSVEMGVMTALLLVAVLAVTVRTLVRRRRDDPLAVVSAAVLTGLAVGALFLHVWTMLAASWSAFVLAGLALPRTSGRPTSAS